MPAFRAESTPSHTMTMIRELLPERAYRTPINGSDVRSALLMAVLWGVPMYLLDGDRSIDLTAARTITAVTALMFGALFVWSMRASARRKARRVYQGDPRIVPAPPPGEHEYRFPCEYQPTPLMSVGGHLYLGPTEWTFVPHARNPPRYRTPVSFATVPPPAVDVVELQLPGWMRTIAPPQPTHLLQVRTPSSTAAFVVPEPQSVAERLREYLGTARHSA